MNTLSQLATSIYSYNITAETRNVLVSTATGGNYFENWKRYSASGWRAYAKKYDIGIIIFRATLAPERGAGRNGSWEKLLSPAAAKTLFPQLEFFCLVDTDVLISPIAENIFTEAITGRYSVVSQERNLPFPIRDVRKRVASSRRLFYDRAYPIDSLILAAPQDVFAVEGLPEHDDYFCAGVIMLDSSLAEDLSDCYYSVSSNQVDNAVAWEEVFVNHWIQSRNPNWLPYEYQALWLFEMAWFYPHLYLKGEEVWESAEAQGAVTSTLWRNHFLHFAGSWFESEVWKTKNVSLQRQLDRIQDAIQETDWQSLSPISMGKILPKRRGEANS